MCTRRNTVLVVSAIMLFCSIFACTKKTDTQQPYAVAIVSIVEIEPIAELRAGFRSEFEASKFAQSHKVVFSEYNAQNDGSIINQIADKMAIEKPDIVYVLGTPVAQAIQKRSPDLLILQGAVTDPVAAGLADSWEGSGRKYIATTDLPPIAKQMSLIQELTPAVRRLGVIYNPGETNSVAVVSRIREYIAQHPMMNMRLVERPISNTSDVATATQSLLGNADAIYLPPDNSVHAAIPVVSRFAKENKTPFYATVSSALDEGALATLSLDFKTLGKESARLALEVLGGKDPAKIPIVPNQNPLVTINSKIAASYSIDLSPFRGKPNVKIIE